MYGNFGFICCKYCFYTVNLPHVTSTRDHSGQKIFVSQNGDNYNAYIVIT
jgi:hypothetical protein